jgi:uncharacterized protein YacL
MKRTLLIIRLVFFLVCLLCGYLVAYVVPEWDAHRWIALGVAGLLGILVILVDLLLKGFSLRGFSAVTFGLFLGWLASALIADSPLFENGDPQLLFLFRLVLFVVLGYVGTALALRGRDEFNLVIPYVRFEPQHVEAPLVVVDTSALIDGRIVGICESRFMGFTILVPGFIIDELHHIADSRDVQKRERGRRGLDTLNKLRAMPYVNIHIHDSELSRGEEIESKIVFVAKSLGARLLTTDYNLAQVAKFHSVEWLNLNMLARSLRTEVAVGMQIEVELVKEGRDAGQAVGYLTDGSMVVVTDGVGAIGRQVLARVQNVLPSAGGRMIFASLLPDDADAEESGDSPDSDQKRVK